MGSIMTGRGQPETMIVRVVTMGDHAVEYVGNPSLSLGELLDELGLDEGLVDVRVNGAPLARTERLRNDDEVLVVPRIRGGASGAH